MAIPLFMDRHDLPGVTSENVAQAHAQDLGPAAEYGVQILAYWFDPDAGGAFCFANAPGADDLAALHQASHDPLHGPRRLDLFAAGGR